MYRMIIALVAGLSALFLILTCGDSPTDPFSSGNADITLLLKSSTFQESDTAVTDTVGKTVRLGLCLYLTQHIDSTIITVSPSSTRNDTVLKCTKKDRSIDTAFYDLVFASAGTRTVSAIAYVGKDLRQVTAKIHIIARPTPNRKPELTVTGPRSIHPGQACTLLVSVNDPDSGQVATIGTLKCPQGSSFDDTVFTWLPTIADTGIDTVIFIARDNGFPVLTDTAIVPITVKLLKVNHPPTWSSDTVDLGGTVGEHISLTLADRCSDTDNDTLSFMLLSGAPDGDTVLNDSYSFTPASAHEGTFYPRIIVRDPLLLSDTLVIKLTISAADTTPPQIRLLSPNKDTTTISASSCQIRISASDESGILSLRCAMGTDSFPVTRSADTVYSATVTGLVQNQFNRITFIAIDSSRSANRCTLSVYIKYDSTMLDAEGPVIIRKSGPTSGSVITNPVIAISDSIIDPSGIDSVYWTVNGVRAGTMSLVSGSTTKYILRDTLSKYRTNRLVVNAIDRSIRRNRDSAVAELDYNLPPVINDTAVTTDRNTAKTWTLSAQSQDNDSLFWSRLSSPSSLSGTITGILPSITFTPATNWSGTDSFYVRVTDGYWSDTAKVKITVIDVPVAPSIVTQPQSLVRSTGQSATFSVTINTDVNPVPSFQWKKNGTTISSANAASFSIGAVAIEDSGSYTVTIINSAGTVTSNPALLNVQYAPIIITQPQSQTLYLGQAATFTVAARGNPAPSYQWKMNGTTISGMTGASFTISSPGVGDSGKYTVSVMNSVDTLVSDTAGFYASAMDVSAGGNHTLFLLTDGRLLACGDRQSGQFGAESQNDILTPLQIGTNVQNMAAGGCHTLIVQRNRTLIACGSNSNGQLGDGSTTNRHIFVTLASEVFSAAGGDFHTFIHKSDNSLWACGWNRYGQLGNGTATDTSLPVYILPGVQDVSSRYYHTLIVKTDGTVWACGLNSNGQLGTGDTARKLTPIQISNSMIAVSAGCAHSLMLKADSSLWACGSGGYGQLCDGIKIDRTTMTKVMEGVKSMSAGGYFSLVLKSDGTLWTCGKNDHGQLGDGNTDDRVTPVQIMSNVKKIAAGFDFSLVIKSDGTVWGFGNNSYGKFGDASTNDYYSPVQIKF
jgi:alpha-tubulin suppressor-like RCC1 family protein